MRTPLLVLLLALSACEAAPDAPDPVATAAPDSSSILPQAVDAAAATLLPLGESGVSGTVEFRRLGTVTEVRYAIDGLSPGEHGFHLHRLADCGADSTGEAGSAAGPHLNPLSSPHGAPAASLTGRHAGDLGNVTADAAGRAEGIVIDSVLTFEGPTTVLGHAVIVHRDRDDLETQPAGDAGDRVACGITEARDRAAMDAVALGAAAPAPE